MQRIYLQKGTKIFMRKNLFKSKVMAVAMLLLGFSIFGQMRVQVNAGNGNESSSSTTETTEDLNKLSEEALLDKLPGTWINFCKATKDSICAIDSATEKIQSARDALERVTSSKNRAPHIEKEFTQKIAEKTKEVTDKTKLYNEKVKILIEKLQNDKWDNEIKGDFFSAKSAHENKKYAEESLDKLKKEAAEANKYSVKIKEYTEKYNANKLDTYEFAVKACSKTVRVAVRVIYRVFEKKVQNCIENERKCKNGKTFTNLLNKDGSVYKAFKEDKGTDKPVKDRAIQLINILNEQSDKINKAVKEMNETIEIIQLIKNTHQLCSDECLLFKIYK